MDITISDDVAVWSSINTLTSISVGTAVWLQNKSSQPLIMVESSTQPDATSTSGVLVSTMHEAYAEKQTSDGDLELWVRPLTYGREVIINIQEA